MNKNDKIKKKIAGLLKQMAYSSESDTEIEMKTYQNYDSQYEPESDDEDSKPPNTPPVATTSR